MIRLGTVDNKKAFQPGAPLEGAALWELATVPEVAEVRLLWFTTGKGSEDGEIVATETFAQPQRGDTRKFRFELPPAPYSFSGKLISLSWCLELVLDGESQRVEFVMAPQGKEIILPTIPQPKFPTLPAVRSNH